MNRERVKSMILYGIFVFYLLLMLDILLLRGMSPMQLFHSAREPYRVIELIPFNQIYGYLSGSFDVSPTTVLHNLLGNILIFIPLGIYFALFRKDAKISANMLFVFLTSLSVEIIQFVLGIGASDIDDIILNCLGGFIGIMIYKGLARFLKKEEKVRSVVTVFSAIVGLPVFVITVLLYVFN
jgi:glycopeptide antibiotics resistance protein